MYSKLEQGIAFIRRVFRDEQFYVALRHVVGSFIPLIICEALGYEGLGLQMMLGAFFISGVDVAGTLRTKTTALLMTTAISISITFLLLLTGGVLWAVLPMLFLFIFGLAYISPFSLRYTMMGIMGYIAIILAISMTGRIHSIEADLSHCFHMLWGSAWYITFALVMHYFARTREITRRVAFCMRQTANYFDQRLALLEPDTDHDEGLLKLAHLQQELNETQESVRELLFETPSILSDRNSERYRFYLIFIELVDMHELAVATPIDYPKIRELLHRYPEYDIIRKIIRRVNREMNNLADVLLNQAEYDAPVRMQEYLDQLQADLHELKQKTSLDNSDEEEAYHTLKRIEQYLHRQLQKVEIMRNAVLNRRVKDIPVNRAAKEISREDLPRFITPNPLNRNSLAGNFSFKSSYFRYALRTATTAVAGYTIAHFLHFQNAYWVLLTVLVVMKPGYGVTKKRFYHRIAGTIAGAIIAYGIYQLHPPHLVSLAIFGVSLLLAFTFVVDNYAIASSLFTIFVIFLYSFLNRQIPTMVIFRVADTVMGGILVILSIFLLWPHWEHQKITYYIRKSLQANKQYLQQVLNYLLDESFNETDYRLARKEAYVDMSNLISSFYRMRDEPKSKQKKVHSSYNLALLNYMLLSATTSLAVFLQRHPDDPLACKEIRVLGNQILATLDDILYKLDQPAPLKEQPEEEVKSVDTEQAGDETIRQKLYQLKKSLDKEPTPLENNVYREYVHLNYLDRQLEWMLELSQSIARHLNQPDAKEQPE